MRRGGVRSAVAGAALLAAFTAGQATGQGPGQSTPGQSTQSQSTPGQSALTELERRVERDHPGVATMPPEALAGRLGDRDGLVILDVREADEFAVSRIPGAERVDPGLGEREFLARFADRLAGRTVVVYCSVGVRSSRLALRIERAARAAGAGGVMNLRGGIFAWANTGRPLVDARGPTRHVHPYSSRWSTYLDDQGNTRYRPSAPAE